MHRGIHQGDRLRGAERVHQADRIIVLKKGKLLCDRTPTELFSDREMIEEGGLEMPPAIDIRDKAGLPESLTTVEEIAAYVASI